MPGVKFLVMTSATSVIHFETQRANKARWVKQAQLEGHGLADWITDALDHRCHDYNIRGMRQRKERMAASLAGTKSEIGVCWMREKQSSGTGPAPEEVKKLRENIQASEGLGITSAQDRCAAMLHTSRRAWQQWERGDRGMHPAFWELVRLKSGSLKLDL